VKKYRDSRYIAIVVLRPLKTITRLRRGQGVTYSVTLCAGPKNGFEKTRFLRFTLYKAVAKQLPANCIPPYKAENSYLPLYYLLLSSSLFTGVMKFIYGRRLINFIYGGVVLC